MVGGQIGSLKENLVRGSGAVEVLDMVSELSHLNVRSHENLSSVFYSTMNTDKGIIHRRFSSPMSLTRVEIMSCEERCFGSFTISL